MDDGLISLNPTSSRSEVDGVALRPTVQLSCGSARKVPDSRPAPAQAPRGQRPAQQLLEAQTNSSISTGSPDRAGATHFLGEAPIGGGWRVASPGCAIAKPHRPADESGEMPCNLQESID